MIPATFIAYVALHLLKLTGLDGQVIEVNPEQIVSLRVPRDEGTLHAGIRCLIHTTDGKFISVLETCDYVEAMMEQQR